MEALLSVLQLSGRVQRDPGRVRWAFSTLDCWHEQEQHVYNIARCCQEWKSTTHSGIALYSAQNYSSKPKERGRIDTIDLGLLMIMLRLSGGPMCSW